MEDMRNVLHQVIAPLNALIGHCSNLAMGRIPEIKIPEKLDYIKILSKIAINYSRNFQKILDIETGNIKLEKESIFDLRKYLIGIVIDYQPLVKIKNIHIHVTEQTKENIGAFLDKDLFDHVILNLLDNAVKYSLYPMERVKIGLQSNPKTPEDEENVLITATKSGKKVAITISNWGLEMSDEEKRNIFKREYRGAKAKDRAPVGTGIGLFLAKEIVNLHGGNIDLLPNTHKNNIVFKITLP
jgi:signal transduction histidine kinase